MSASTLGGNMPSIPKVFTVHAKPMRIPMSDRIIDIARTITLMALAVIVTVAVMTGHPRPQPQVRYLTMGGATARAADITGHLMECWGEYGAYQCRQWNSQAPGPIVVCYEGDCKVAGLPALPIPLPNLGR